MNEDKYVRDRLARYGDQNAAEAKMDYDYLKKNQVLPRGLKEKDPERLARNKKALHEQLHKIVRDVMVNRNESEFKAKED